MGEERSLPGFEDRSLPDRYCDLVLTGGVTSAIAYPGAIYGLAQAYRFNSIGGSSSGAGSAALAAAAEYRRRHGSTEGFRTLLRRTTELKNNHGGSKTGLAWLFQPDAWSKRLFGAVLPTFAGPARRRSKLFIGLAKGYWGNLLSAFFLVSATVLGIGVARHPPDWFNYIVTGHAPALKQISQASHRPDWCIWFVAAVLTGTFVALFWTSCRIWGDIKRAADADYGLCSGMAIEAGAKHPPITLWLHQLLQDIAGLPLARPLTFADLHDAPAGPRDTLGDASPAGARSIDLRMFAADVTQGRPLLLPLRETDPALYFRPRELRRLFPKEVVDAMMEPQATQSPQRESAANAIEPKRTKKHPRSSDPDEEEDLWKLPLLTLPVVVAARMSVSFPILFSAVPLWQRAPDGKRFRRLLFADGGLCSNFPIHLFDSLIPAWPTFGVALFDGGGKYSLDPDCIANRVYVPQTHRERRTDCASKFDDQDQPIDRLLGFVGAMFSTVKDWNDALLAELPGVRERIAEVALPDNIGGLNILMDAKQIECLGLLGGAVARKLLVRYAVPDGSGGQAPGWREHRWVRFNVLSECLRQSLLGLSRAAEHSRYAEPLREQIRNAVDRPPLAGKGERALELAEAATLERTLDVLLQIERALTASRLEQPYQPEPKPELRVRPPL